MTTGMTIRLYVAAFLIGIGTIKYGWAELCIVLGIFLCFSIISDQIENLKQSLSGKYDD